jgi:hypothetical protein
MKLNYTVTALTDRCTAAVTPIYNKETGRFGRARRAIDTMCG